MSADNTPTVTALEGPPTKSAPQPAPLHERVQATATQQLDERKPDFLNISAKAFHHPDRTVERSTAELDDPTFSPIPPPNERILADRAKMTSFNSGPGEVDLKDTMSESSFKQKLQASRRQYSSGDVLAAGEKFVGRPPPEGTSGAIDNGTVDLRDNGWVSEDGKRRVRIHKKQDVAAGEQANFEEVGGEEDFKSNFHMGITTGDNALATAVAERELQMSARRRHARKALGSMDEELARRQGGGMYQKQREEHTATVTPQIKAWLKDVVPPDSEWDQHGGQDKRAETLQSLGNQAYKASFESAESQQVRAKLQQHATKRDL